MDIFNRIQAKWKGSRLRSTAAKTCRAVDRAEDGSLRFLYRWRFPLFVVSVTVLAFAGRFSLWPVVSADYNECLHIWLEEIRQGKGFHTIGTQVGNYTAPYHYLMAAMTYIPGLTNLAVIKITSSLADFCMAGAAAAVCWQLTKSQWKTCACYALVLCLPTVFLNSAAWGQCDAMYTCFVLLFLAFLLKEKRGTALFFYGIALAVKLQTIFVLPAVIILWLCGRVRFRHLLSGALGYVLMFIPAMIGDGSIAPLYRAYAMQTKVHSIASNIFNGASLFMGIDEGFLGYLSTTLITATVILLGTLALYCWKSKACITAQSEFILIALSAVLIPFLLPAMKDRYYFMIEVMAVVYALAWPKRLAAPLLIQFASLPCYMSYLVGAEIPFSRWPVLSVAAVPFMLLRDLQQLLSSPPAPATAGQTACVE